MLRAAACVQPLVGVGTEVADVAESVQCGLSHRELQSHEMNMEMKEVYSLLLCAAGACRGRYVYTHTSAHLRSE